MDYKKVIGTKIRNLNISEVIQVYFGINKTKADYIYSNKNNDIISQNIIVSCLQPNQVSKFSVLRNKNAFPDNFTRLLTKKDRRNYYSALKRRIKKEAKYVIVESYAYSPFRKYKTTGDVYDIETEGPVQIK